VKPFASGKPREYTTTLYRTPSAAELSLAGRFCGFQELNRFRKTARSENSLVALKLLSPDGESAWPVMHKLSQALSDIEVDCSVLECEGEPCLFVNCRMSLPPPVV
jgi:hypothetical protein